MLGDLDVASRGGKVIAPEGPGDNSEVCEHVDSRSPRGWGWFIKQGLFFDEYLPCAPRSIRW